MTIFSVQHNLDALARQLDDKARRQLPFATAKALTRTAYDIRAETLREMGAKFDRPTPYTLRSMQVEIATKGYPVATVGLRIDTPGKGTPWNKALAHQFTGGGRAWKRFEQALFRAGVLPKGMAAVPGGGAPLDAYGNLQRGLITQLLAYFSAFGEQGYRANMTDRRRAKLANQGLSAQGFKRINGVVYFISRGKGWQLGARRGWVNGREQHLPPGIWAKTGTHGADLKPVILFVRRPVYQPRIDLRRIGARVIGQRFERHLREALAGAMGPSGRA